ncbi:MAG: acyl-CoA dehydrogenase family protein [Syntrophobacteraceae bacterium]
MISFELSTEQKRAELKFMRLAKKKLHPLSLKIDAQEPGPIDPAYLDILADEDLNAFLVPKQYGGRPLDFITLSLVIEGLAYGCAGFASIYGATLHAVSAVLIGGSHDQKAAYLPLLLGHRGKPAGCCITEQKGGSDTSRFSTTAYPDGQYYILNGTKSPVINAGDAAFYVVWANTNTGKGRGDINAFIVPGDSPGISIGPYHDKPGLRCAPTATVSFSEVQVHSSDMIGLQGSGYPLLMQSLDWSRALFSAICVGVAKAAFDQTAAFAKQRSIRNKPIIKNQGIGFSLADYATDICAGRLLVWRACRMMDRNAHYTKEASMAKLFASRMAARIASEGMLIMGLTAHTGPNLMAKFQRDTQVLRLLEGTDHIQKIIISSQI